VIVEEQVGVCFFCFCFERLDDKVAPSRHELTGEGGNLTFVANTLKDDHVRSRETNVAEFRMFMKNILSEQHANSSVVVAEDGEHLEVVRLLSTQIKGTKKYFLPQPYLC
jgi:hypothetical protein